MVQFQVTNEKGLQCQKHDSDPSRSAQSMTAEFTRLMQAGKQDDHQLQETGKNQDLNSANRWG